MLRSRTGLPYAGLREFVFSNFGASVTIKKKYERFMVWPRRVGDYMISSVLGHGSFGEVRFGKHINTRKACAVKILQYDVLNFDEHSRDIRREMSILMATQHPFIVPLFDIIYDKAKLYLVMELAECDLETYILSHGPLSESMARRCFQQLVRAVLHCHARGIFHRDIKPENLLLTDNFSTLKLADFGFAAVVDKYSGEHPLMKTMCGSRYYCAPEVFRGKGYDAALADAYSCGAVLRSMLIGVQWVEKWWSHGEPDREEDRDFPEHLSNSAMHLVMGLMEQDSEKRLTLGEIQRHPWVTIEASSESMLALHNDQALDELDWIPFVLHT